MTTLPFTPPTSPRESVQLNDHARLAPSSPHHLVQTRPLSDNELSYFLPSRAMGVNDMYLHHHLSTPSPLLFNEHRMALVWAILRARHPLLASEVIKTNGEWSFRYDPPANANEAINEAFDALSCPRDNLTGQDLIDSYLNGPRLLSPSRLSFLVISRATSTQVGQAEFDLLLCTTHFVGDGIALHTFANELYGLIANGGTELELRHMLEDEIESRSSKQVSPFPRSTEELIASATEEASVAGSTKAAMVRAASKVALARSQRKAVGSQTFSRLRGSSSEVRTVVPTVSYPAEETKRILARCKKEGVSVSNAVFGLVGVAWGRVLLAEAEKGNVLEPMLLYSALSLRSYLPKTSPTTPTQSYFHLSLGYYTITFPSFLPSDTSSSPHQTFWARSRSSKTQTITHLKSKLLVGKITAEAEQRRVRAVKWADEDDKVAAKAAMLPKQDGLVGLGFEGLEVKESSVVETTVQDVQARTRRDGRAMSPVDVFRAKMAREMPDTPPMTPGKMFGSPELLVKQVLPNTTVAPLTPPQTSSPKFASAHTPPPAKTSTPPASAPLLGLSLLGNLDGIYQHATFAPALTLTALTTGSRQRQGGILLFAYTFAGKLWLSLGWDQQGFTEEGRRQVEGLWEGVQGGVGEFLLA